MATRLPTQMRPHREMRAEPPHRDAPFGDVPAMHFKPALLSQSDAAALPSQVPGVSPLRILQHFAQNLQTSLPLLAMDCLGLTLCLLISSVVTNFAFTNSPSTLDAGPLLLSNGLVFVLIYALLGLYPGVGVNPIVELKSLVQGTLTATATLLVFTVAVGQWTVAQGTFILLLAMLELVIGPLFRCSARALFCNCSWWRQPAIIVGSRESCVKLMKVLEQKTLFGLRPVGIVTDTGHSSKLNDSRDDFLGSLSDLPELAAEHKVFWALLAPGESGTQGISQVLDYCSTIPNVVMIPGFEEFPSLWNRTQDFGGVMGICYRERLLDPKAQICKRLFDITAVLLGTLLLAPLLLPMLIVTWICMKLYSPGPIFYGQDRVGKDGQTFTAWKFRTMVLKADVALKEYLAQNPEKKLEWDLNQKLRHDPRIVPGIGSLLRKTSLDELPQLWNVLCGDMSLVGPRPFMTEQTEIYGDRLQLYRKVRPGITGLWQISGRNHTTFEERAKFDAYYVRNWSFWLDIFILGRTVKTVLFREGAF